MPNITFNGLGSGLQVSDIVGAIVNSEKAPFEARLKQQKNSLTTDISAAGALKSALEKVKDSMSALADSKKYQQRAASGDDDFISLSSDKNAAIGEYSIKVDQLATKHKLSSAAFAEADPVGAGTLAISAGSTSFNIDVSATATLDDIKTAINEHADNSGVTATIITGDSGQHLVLSSNETGVANQITIAATDADGNNTDASGLSRLAYDSGAGVSNMNQVRAAQDASITIDGTLSVSSSSNEFKNVIEGVDITVKKVHGVDDDISTAQLAENNDNIKESLNEFVKAYNSLYELSGKLGRSGEGGAGPMAGDSLLRGVMSKVRQQFTQQFNVGGGESTSLTQIGIEIDRYGKMSLDEERLDKTVKANVDHVQQFFVGDDTNKGFASSMDDLLGLYTKSDGLIQGRLDSRESQLRRLEDESLEFTRKMDSLESRLFAQYNAMDQLVANMRATGDYVQAQLSSLPGVAKKSN